MRLTMPTSETSLSLPRRLIGPFICVLVLFYLGFHAVSGERGLVVLFKETRKLEQLEAKLDAVQSRRAQMEKKIRLMSSRSLDLDMLDEQARQVIGYAGKDEVVLFTK